MSYQTELQKYTKIRREKWITALQELLGWYKTTKPEDVECPLCEQAKWGGNTFNCDLCPWTVFYGRESHMDYPCLRWARQISPGVNVWANNYVPAFDRKEIQQKRIPIIKRWIRHIEKSLE